MTSFLQTTLQPHVSTSTVFVGRQPIFTHDLQTVAYELLFRSDNINRANPVDGQCATAKVLLNTFSEIGLERIVGKLPAFINVPESFLLNEHSLALPKDRVVLEVLETVRPTRPVLAALTKLRDQGYTIAIDDFVFSERLLPLVELADIIKVELPAIPEDDLEKHVQLLRNYDVRILAEKLETPEQFEFCKSLGFDYYQGYFFSRPTILTGRQLPTHRLTMIRLIARLRSPHVSFNEVAEIIRTEPALSLKLLRYVNSAYVGFNHRIESVRHAVTLAGIQRIKSFCSLLLLAQVVNDKPAQLMQTVLVRARMAELLSTCLNEPKADSFFLVGLFSAIDALLDVPMQEALEMISVSQEVENALKNHTGILGIVLKCVLEYERGHWQAVSCDRLGDSEIRTAYLESLEWAEATARGTFVG